LFVTFHTIFRVKGLNNENIQSPNAKILPTIIVNIKDTKTANNGLRNMALMPVIAFPLKNNISIPIAPKISNRKKWE
jgi:hypothetical protein